MPRNYKRYNNPEGTLLGYLYNLKEDILDEMERIRVRKFAIEKQGKNPIKQEIKWLTMNTKVNVIEGAMQVIESGRELDNSVLTLIHNGI